jgi:hypothetical protein
MEEADHFIASLAERLEGIVAEIGLSSNQEAWRSYEAHHYRAAVISGFGDDTDRLSPRTS